jgi:hypothetical protein
MCNHNEPLATVFLGSTAPANCKTLGLLEQEYTYSPLLWTAGSGATNLTMENGKWTYSLNHEIWGQLKGLIVIEFYTVCATPSPRSVYISLFLSFCNSPICWRAWFLNKCSDNLAAASKRREFPLYVWVLRVRKKWVENSAHVFKYTTLVQNTQTSKASFCPVANSK